MGTCCSFSKDKTTHLALTQKRERSESRKKGERDGVELEAGVGMLSKDLD